MKNRRLALVTLALFGLLLMIGPGQTGYAQSTVTPICATMEQDSLNRLRYPRLGTLSEFEYNIQQSIREFEEKRRTGKTTATLLTIPIIVHVVHNGEPIGTGTNLSKEQVQSQIEVLNEDFRRKPGTPGFNNNPVGADIEIEFCLSPVDETGTTMNEPGIHRYNGNKTSWTRAEIENQLKPTTIWNPNLFYNIWTVRFATSESTLIGYAQFPDQSGLSGLPASGPAATDGVVIRYQSFGSTDKGNFPVMEAPFNKGRTLSHETGHWLGLRHIWGDGNCADDFVSDTPPASGPSSGCPTGRVSCGGLNMVENYMDYSNDACMNIFTQGQKIRMLAVMEVSPRRKTLVQASLCSPQVADVPTANFEADKQLVLKGGEAFFTDLSTNFPTAWNWTFDGGDPSSSTERNPKVTYNVPGTYAVRLVATNSLGASAPLVLEGFITVSEDGLCGSLTNFEPTFTPSVLSMADFGSSTGYLTGHNSSNSKAISEFFKNESGYEYISGVKINFGAVLATSEEATVNVTVWNARGPQNAPGSVIEKKVVLLKQIKSDIDVGQATTIVFDRETPIFSRPFQVGIELNYVNGDKLAIRSSANGQALNATSWIQAANGTWEPYAIALGANIAMDIEPLVGMNPSVQVASSKLLINPGEEVILNGRGASIFVWDSSDGSVKDFTGPQLSIKPRQTTVVTTTGSGLELCNNTATTTIYIRDTVVGIQESSEEETASVYPNPGNDQLYIQSSGAYRGKVAIQLIAITGQTVFELFSEKQTQQSTTVLDTGQLVRGVYLVRLQMGGETKIIKWIKL